MIFSQVVNAHCLPDLDRFRKRLANDCLQLHHPRPYSILISLLICLLSHSLPLPCNPPKQLDHVQYVTSPSRRGTPFSRLVSDLSYQKCEEEIDADGVVRLSNFVGLLDT